MQRISSSGHSYLGLSGGAGITVACFVSNTNFKVTFKYWCHIRSFSISVNKCSFKNLSYYQQNKFYMQFWNSIDATVFFSYAFHTTQSGLSSDMQDLKQEGDSLNNFNCSTVLEIKKKKKKWAEEDKHHLRAAPVLPHGQSHGYVKSSVYYFTPVAQQSMYAKRSCSIMLLNYRPKKSKTTTGFWAVWFELVGLFSHKDSF